MFGCPNCTCLRFDQALRGKLLVGFSSLNGLDEVLSKPVTITRALEGCIIFLGMLQNLANVKGVTKKQ